ncbi:MAG TPA: amidohydrolase family protein [Solirubrobacteraceae bacterium]|nr:amidohydrolase family protein [Solirubrobacteraceae bacterium]
MSRRSSDSGHPLQLFDSHLHIIDPRFPLVGDYRPEPFTVEDYRRRIAGIEVVGGAVVSGSFQGFDQTYLLDALQRLGPAFVGVTQLPSTVADEEVLALDAAGVRAVRFTLARGGALDIDLALRVHELAGWHAEVYATDLPAHEAALRELPRLVVDHLGMNPEGLAAAVRLGAMVKATPRVTLDARAVPPGHLLFGTDLPGTRTERVFAPEHLDVIAGITNSALVENARAWYRPRA